MTMAIHYVSYPKSFASNAASSEQENWARPVEEATPDRSRLRARLIGAYILQSGIGVSALLYGSLSDLWGIAYGGAALVALTCFQLWRDRR